MQVRRTEKSGEHVGGDAVELGWACEMQERNQNRHHSPLIYSCNWDFWSLGEALNFISVLAFIGNDPYDIALGR